MSGKYSINFYNNESDLPVWLKESVRHLPVQEFRDASSDDILFFQFEDRPLSFELARVFEQAPGHAWFHDWYLRTETDGMSNFRRVAELARSASFSTFRNAQECARMLGKFPSFIPYPSSQEAKPFPVTPRCGVAYCGSPLVEDHFHILARAVLSAAPDFKIEWMLAKEELTAARELLREFPALKVEFIEGRTAVHWERALEASDLAAHLRFSAFGDFGPFLAQSLLSGRPVLLSRYGDAGEIAPGALILIETGEREQDEIEVVLRGLANPANSLSALGARGRSWAEEFHPSRLVGAELSQLFESV